MPDLDTFPLIQCHHVLAFASFGGFLNPSSKVKVCASFSIGELHPKLKNRTTKMTNFFIRYFLFIIFEVNIVTGPNKPEGNKSSVAFWNEYALNVLRGPSGSG